MSSTNPGIFTADGLRKLPASTRRTVYVAGGVLGALAILVALAVLVAVAFGHQVPEQVLAEAVGILGLALTLGGRLAHVNVSTIDKVLDVTGDLLPTIKPIESDITAVVDKTSAELPADLSSLTIAQLRVLAKDAGLTPPAKALKAKLIKDIQKATK